MAKRKDVALPTDEDAARFQQLRAYLELLTAEAGDALDVDAVADAELEGEVLRLQAITGRGTPDAPPETLATRVERAAVVDTQATLVSQLSTASGRTMPVVFHARWANEADTVMLVGEFNDWSTAATPMERSAEGGFVATVQLEPGRHYRYKYLVDGSRWENDWQADDYVPNEHGGDDSVRIVPDEHRNSRQTLSLPSSDTVLANTTSSQRPVSAETSSSV